MSEPHPHWITPQWPAPASVSALSTTRRGGHSAGPYSELNLADHVGDRSQAVAANRCALGASAGLPGQPLWLEQVHGSRCVDADGATGAPRADGAVAHQPGAVCAVLTADCLPVLLCDRDATTVAALHAGWRGLAAGIIETGVAATGVPPGRLLAWLGPAIGARRYEVGEEVHAALCAVEPRAFTPAPRAGQWYADLYALARARLAGAGVTAVYGGGHCTASEPHEFFSYRRDGVCGRMATLIWLEPKHA